MKKVVLVFILFMVSSFMFAEKVAVLEEINKPSAFAVDQNQLYVCEGVTVYIFSLKDYKLVKKFGKQGEGPEEFNRGVAVYPLKDKLLMNTGGKIAFYTKAGNYISEIKSKGGFSQLFLPLGKNFIGQGTTVANSVVFRTISLYDSNLQKKKELIKYKSFFQQGKKINPLDIQGKLYQVLGEKIFINSENGKINIHDKEGKIVGTINHSYPKVKVTDKDKEGILSFYKTNPQTRQQYEAFKHLIILPKVFPSIQNILPKDKKVFVLTFKREAGKAQFFVFDLAGKLVKQTMVPFFSVSPQFPQPFDIIKGKLYQLAENEDDEEWELHINKIL